MQETWVLALIWEDFTCQGATEPVALVRHYWACALYPVLHKREVTAMRSCALGLESSPCSPQPEKARVQPQRPSAARKKEVNLKQELVLCIFGCSVMDAISGHLFPSVSFKGNRFQDSLQQPPWQQGGEFRILCWHVSPSVVSDSLRPHGL